MERTVLILVVGEERLNGADYDLDVSSVIPILFENHRLEVVLKVFDKGFLGLILQFKTVYDEQGSAGIFRAKKELGNGRGGIQASDAGADFPQVCFIRRIQNVLGKSPLLYFQSLRVERGVHLLKTSNASVEEIAAKVGYRDGGTLRLLLRRRLDLGVKEIRRTS